MAQRGSNIEMAPTALEDQKVVMDVNTETIEAVSGDTNKAAQLLKEVGHSIIVTPEENKRILRKIDLAILPIILVIYCMQFLDKAALSYASVFGLIKDTNLVGSEYSWLGSIVYVAQLVWQPVVAYMLVKFPIGKFCTAMVFCWGATLCGMAAAHNFGGLMATRFLLGSFEASVAPINIALVQMWYRRSEQTNRNALWYSTLGVVNVLGSLLSFGLGHIDTSVLHSYQIIFLFCGLLTVVWSVVVFFFLPDSPMTAKFLRRGDDRLIAIERLRMNQQGISSGEWRWDHVRECLLDVKTWIWVALLTAVSIPSGGISTFGPLIVKSFGFDSFTTILFNMPFGAVQVCATLGAAWAATRYKVKSPVLALLCLPPIAGLAMMLNIPYDKSNRGALLAAYYLTSFYPAISPLIYSWSGANTAGDTKRKMTTAMLFVGASAGNIAGPNLFKPSQKPHYTSGLTANLIIFCVMLVIIAIGAAYIRLMNHKHAARRVALGKPEKIIDLSMESNKELGQHDEAANDTQQAGGVGDHAFSDMTDLQNEDFVYVY